MRIKILRTVGNKDTLPRTSDNPTSLELPAKADGTMYQEGDEVDLKDVEATKFLEAGMAETADKAKTAEKATDAYPTMTVEELHHEATRRNLDGRSELKTKDQLIAALEKDDKAKKK